MIADVLNKAGEVLVDGEDNGNSNVEEHMRRCGLSRLKTDGRAQHAK